MADNNPPAPLKLSFSTPGVYTSFIPGGATRVQAIVVGGGGNGGPPTVNAGGGGGGGGGSGGREFLLTSAETKIKVNVGNNDADSFVSCNFVLDGALRMTGRKGQTPTDNIGGHGGGEINALVSSDGTAGEDGDTSLDTGLGGPGGTSGYIDGPLAVFNFVEFVDTIFLGIGGRGGNWPAGAPSNGTTGGVYLKYFFQN